MLIKKAKYKNVKKIVRALVHGDIYGCDTCKKVIKDRDFLELTVWYQDIKKYDTADNPINRDTRSRHFSFCSWECLLKLLPSIKTDDFMSLPSLIFGGNKVGAVEFIDIIKRKV